MLPRTLYSILLAGAYLLPAFADTTFRHPKEDFTILVPDGWQTDSQAGGVNVSNGPSYVGVFVVHGKGDARELLRMITPQLTRQWKRISELRSADCKFSTFTGYCAWYEGVNPKDVDSNLKASALIDDGKAYLVFVESPKTNPANVNRMLDRIEQSFTPGGGPAISQSVDARGTPSPQSNRPQSTNHSTADLAALEKDYEAGRMTTEDYEARRAALLSGNPLPPSQGSPRSPKPADTSKPVDSYARTSSGSPGADNSSSFRPNPVGLRPDNSSNGALGPLAPQLPQSGRDNSDGIRFQSPDRTFETRIPPGWRQLPTPPNFAGTWFFGPESGGDERIMMGSGPLLVNSIQLLSASAAGVVTTLYPGLRLARAPAYGNTQGLPAAELLFQGTLQNGVPAEARYYTVMAGPRYAYVLSVSRAANSQRTANDGQFVFDHLMPF
jgi:hypothetical protein